MQRSNTSQEECDNFLKHTPKLEVVKPYFAGTILRNLPIHEAITLDPALVTDCAFCGGHIRDTVNHYFRCPVICDRMCSYAQTFEQKPKGLGRRLSQCIRNHVRRLRTLCFQHLQIPALSDLTRRNLFYCYVFSLGSEQRFLSEQNFQRDVTRLLRTFFPIPQSPFRLPQQVLHVIHQNCPGSSFLVISLTDLPETWVSWSRFDPISPDQCLKCFGEFSWVNNFNGRYIVVLGMLTFNSPRFSLICQSFRNTQVFSRITMVIRGCSVQNLKIPGLIQEFCIRIDQLFIVRYNNGKDILPVRNSLDRWRFDQTDFLDHLERNDSLYRIMPFLDVSGVLRVFPLNWFPPDLLPVWKRLLWESPFNFLLGAHSQKFIELLKQLGFVYPKVLKSVRSTGRGVLRYIYTHRERFCRQWSASLKLVKGSVPDM